MDKERIFSYLEKQEKEVLLRLLDRAYDRMGHDSRHDVFGEHEKNAPLLPVDGKVLLSRIEDFQRSSLSGYYYEPFDINSKNYMDIPDETEEWFEKLGDYLKSASQLTTQGDHTAAVACFEMLYQVIEKMEDGYEIVFGDEIGSWMIPGDEKLPMRAYLTSLAAISTPTAFANAVTPLAQRDSYHSLSLKVYDTACQLANAAQKAAFVAEVTRLKIQTKSRW